MITIEELMVIERFLLEIDVRFKFDLPFSEALKLYEFLKSVGRITNLYFKLLDEHYSKFNDPIALQEYRNKISGEEIEFDTEEIKKFIDNIYERVDNVEFKNIVLKNRFWKINQVD
jgi:hypothetical protein